MELFGTDGIRGVFGKVVTAELCYNAGRAIAEYFACDAVLGRDTRIGSLQLAQAVAAGVCEGGHNVFDCGIIPSPAISHLSRRKAHPLGVMITASHNPPEYNGIKLFFGGEKLSAEEEAGIEYCITAAKSVQIGTKACGKLQKFDGAAEEYIAHLLSGAGRLDGVKIRLDLAFGAGVAVAGEVFSRLGAAVKCVNCAAEGSRINVDCGALYPERLCAQTTESEFGFALDGDGDRLSVVYKGRVLDGDSVLYNLSKGEPPNAAVVGTVMSNSALLAALNKDGRRLIMTDVGDKNIFAAMKKWGAGLGGEQSGHYIFYPKAYSGDALLAALNVAQTAKTNGLTALKLHPQKTVSLYAPRSAADHPLIKKLTEKHRQNLTRLTVRYSGTEPKIRISAQAENEAAVDGAIYDFTGLISRLNAADSGNDSDLTGGKGVK